MSNTLTSEPATDTRTFVYRHVVCFEETNVVGNVYFARHISWQGKCREMFLKANAPKTLDLINEGLRLVTLQVSCDYFEEAKAFDDIELHMSLRDMQANRLTLRFDYYCVNGGARNHIAVGDQKIGCMQLVGDVLQPTAIPTDLKTALTNFSSHAD